MSDKEMTLEQQVWLAIAQENGISSPPKNWNHATQLFLKNEIDEMTLSELLAVISNALEEKKKKESKIIAWQVVDNLGQVKGRHTTREEAASHVAERRSAGYAAEIIPITR